jgi:hypothetical protein
MNARLILDTLDRYLDAPVELTLYGRAALQLGFADPPPETLLSRDVDAVLWQGQAEALQSHTNFWEAVERVNQILSDQGLYISHFFTEDQVILRPGWRAARRKIDVPFQRLVVFRLADEDLLLSKLMRDDPQDQQDARFIMRVAGLDSAAVEFLLKVARVPPIPEIEEQFRLASARLLRPAAHG